VDTGAPIRTLGPVLYGLGFAHLGVSPSLAIGAAVVLLIGLGSARLLGERSTVV